MDKSTDKKKTPKEMTMARRKTKHGIVTATTTVIVIALILALNAFLSTKKWNYDFTSNKLYTLSGATKKMLKSLDKDQKIHIYFLNKESSVATEYKTILSQYEKASSKVKVEYKDLNLYPNFAKKYLSDSQTAAADDMIVVCDKRSRYISSSDYLSQSYDSSGATKTSVNMEPKVTSAIDYVTSKETPVVYTLSGQGETALGTNISSLLADDNYDVKTLDIVQEGKIPSDCKLLIINAPTKDLDTSITDMLEEYMKNDGRLYVTLEPTKSYTNLNKFLAKYGVKVQKGIVFETSSGAYTSENPMYLLPTMASHDITTPLNSQNLRILAPFTKGLVADSKVKDYTVTDLLTTSEAAFSKVDLNSQTVEKTDKDIAGPFAVAQLVSNSKGEGIMVVCGSAAMYADKVDDLVSKANSNFVSNSINYMTKEESKIAVKATTLDNSAAVFTAFASKMVMALGVIGIPLFILIIGLVVWIVRRNS